MNCELFLDAMENIDEEYIVSAQKRLASAAPIQIGKTLRKTFFLAAAIIACCALTAFAAVLSLRNAAREDMGIFSETPIPEWTEYDADQPHNGEKAVELLATMCSGKLLYAYFEVSPISAEIAAILADNTSPQYEWDLSGTNTRGCAYHVEQTSYDPETQTSLVKVQIHGEELEQIEQVELSLALTHNLKEEATFGPVIIPVTLNQTFSCPANVAVENTKAQFESVWGSRGETVSIPDYVSEGKINRISICAGYIEIEVETPGIEKWITVSNADQVDIESSPEVKALMMSVLFCNNWIASVTETLSDARLNYKDGTSVVIDELPRDFAAAWHLDSKSMDAVHSGKQIYRFIPKQAFDLSLVKSITVCDTEYSFMTEA